MFFEALQPQSDGSSNSVAADSPSYASQSAAGSSTTSVPTTDELTSAVEALYQVAETNLKDTRTQAFAHTQIHVAITAAAEKISIKADPEAASSASSSTSANAESKQELFTPEIIAAFGDILADATSLDVLQFLFAQQPKHIIGDKTNIPATVINATLALFEHAFEQQIDACLQQRTQNEKDTQQAIHANRLWLALRTNGRTMFLYYDSLRNRYDDADVKWQLTEKQQKAHDLLSRLNSSKDSMGLFERADTYSTFLKHMLAPSTQSLDKDHTEQASLLNPAEVTGRLSAWIIAKLIEQWLINCEIGVEPSRLMDHFQRLWMHVDDIKRWQDALARLAPNHKPDVRAAAKLKRLYRHMLTLFADAKFIAPKGFSLQALFHEASVKEKTVKFFAQFLIKEKENEAPTLDIESYLSIGHPSVREPQHDYFTLAMLAHIIKNNKDEDIDPDKLYGTLSALIDCEAYKNNPIVGSAYKDFKTLLTKFFELARDDYMVLRLRNKLNESWQNVSSTPSSSTASSSASSSSVPISDQASLAAYFQKISQPSLQRALIQVYLWHFVEQQITRLQTDAKGSKKIECFYQLRQELINANASTIPDDATLDKLIARLAMIVNHKRNPGWDSFLSFFDPEDAPPRVATTQQALVNSPTFFDDGVLLRPPKTSNAQSAVSTLLNLINPHAQQPSFAVQAAATEARKWLETKISTINWEQLEFSITDPSADAPQMIDTFEKYVSTFQPGPAAASSSNK